MEFLVVLFLFFVGAQIVNALAKQGQGKRLPPGAEAPAPEVEGEQVIRIGPLTIRVPPEARQAQGQPPATLAAPDPWWEEAPPPEETPDFDAAVYEPDSVALAAYEPPPEVSVAPRPLPPEPVALDREVDREAEHARLHARTLRPPTQRPPRETPRDTLGDLRDRAALRRAILAAEVLGPPRALRDLGD